MSWKILTLKDNTYAVVYVGDYGNTYMCSREDVAKARLDTLNKEDCLRNCAAELYEMASSLIVRLATAWYSHSIDDDICQCADCTKYQEYSALLARARGETSGQAQEI